jgi:hypothetical protein
MSRIHRANRPPMFYSNCDDQLIAASLIFRSIAARCLSLHSMSEREPLESVTPARHTSVFTKATFRLAVMLVAQCRTTCFGFAAGRLV